MSDPEDANQTSPAATDGQATFTKSDRALLERLASQLQRQGPILDELKQKVGCLYMWLWVSLILGVLAFVVRLAGR